MKKPSRWLAFIMLLVFFTTMIPGWQTPVRAAVPVINNIYIERTDNEILETAQGIIEIDGSNLKDVTVRVRTTGGGGSKVLGTDVGTRVTNNDDYQKFQLPGADMRSIIWDDGLVIGAITVPVNETDMAAITGVTPGVAYTGTDMVTINGSNLDKDTLSFGNGNMNGTVARAADGSKITITAITGDLGLHDVIFTRDDLTKPGGITGKLSFRKLYQNQFRVVQKLQIANLEMYPNTGEAQKTTVYLQAPALGDYSVFFLRNLTDPYYNTNMGTNYEHVSNPLPANSLIKVKVPNLEAGTYQVVLTNKLDNPASGQDLRNLITQEMQVGGFVIVSSTNAAEVVSVTPASGPNLNSNPLSIVGYNLDELNIDNLSITNTAGAGKAFTDGTYKVLRITYGSGTYQPGAASKNVTVTRDIRVIVGADCIFQPIASQQFLDNNYDTLQVMTDIVPDIDIKDNPVRDVVVDITTTLTVSATEAYTFRALAAKENGFTFIKSYTEPVITKATPDKIQVEQQVDLSYKTKDEMYVGISGSNFIVSKYTDPVSGQVVVHYPAVDLGGKLYFRREGNDASNVYDRNSVLITGATMEVYNNQALVDGSTGNNTGNRILIKIPAALAVDVTSAQVNTPIKILITNPKKDSIQYGYAVSSTVELIEFADVPKEQTPSITGVTPNIVSTEGYKGVQITGYNFEANVQLFIEDTLIPCTRDALGQTITFDAPAWKEGMTHILVMNPEGGQDSANLIYVSSQTKPSITSIAPPEGTIGTTVVINGGVFMSPDPTATPWDVGVYRLIGVRVLLGDRDINDYYYQPGTNNIGLQSYTAPAGKPILSVDANGSPSLADYYYSVLFYHGLLTNPDKFYVFKYGSQGQILLNDGSNIYTISVSSTGDLQATDQDGGTWSVVPDISSLILTKGATVITLAIATPYQVDAATKNITGNRVKVVDQGKRVYAVIPDLITSGPYDVSVVNPDTNRATLESGFTFFRQPQRVPKMNTVVPGQGSVDGGYPVHITGIYFEDNGTAKTRVFINCIEVPAADVSVGGGGTTLDVIVPAFPGDLLKDYGVDHKAVPVSVLNPSDGGASTNIDFFTYMVPNSNPVIDQLTPTEGSTSGGDYVKLTGHDFRYYEPFVDNDGDFTYDDGELFTNINGDKKADLSPKWTDFSSLGTTSGMSTDDLKVLPQVYFGSQKATIKDFGGNFIGVIAPPGAAGQVNVYVVNNDYAISNKLKYTYKASTIKIDKVTPPQGTTNTEVVVDGSGFLSPDPTVAPTDQGIYRLIGTRLLFSGRDINDYNTSASGAITLQSYKTPATQAYIVSPTGKLADYYYGVLLYEGALAIADRFYVLKYDAQGRTVLTDGSNVYTISVSGGALQATDQNGKTWSVVVDDSSVILNNGGPGGTTITLSMATPYAKDADGKITGNRMKVVDNGSRIYATVPDLGTSGAYDVTVLNPDGSADTLTGGFIFSRQPQHVPVLTKIDPTQGSVSGGYYVTITGNYFEDNGTVKSRVFINGVEVAATDVSVSPDNKSVYAKVPAYPGDLLQDLGVARKTVPVSVLNPSDGGASTKEDFFTYIVPNSNPVIDKISPIEGSTAGGDYVQITGRDFRYYEPYEDANGNLQYDDTSTPPETYTELNKDGKWTDFSNLTNTVTLSEADDDFKVLPQVYFGSQKATIMDFGNGYLGVLTPPGSAGQVDVYVINNDDAISNKTKFTYSSKKPTITSIVPGVGRKQGNELVEITGSNFVRDNMTIVTIDTNGDTASSIKNMVVVRFGDVANSGQIIGGTVPNLVLPGSLSVNYNSVTQKITFTIDQDNHSYSRTFDYDGSPCYFDMASLADTGTPYTGYELVKAYVQEHNLVVERGYSPLVGMTDSGHLTVHTPSYYTVEKVPVKIINPDGGTASGEFEYKNPASTPAITSITGDGKDPIASTVNGAPVRIVQVNYKGGSMINITGTGFLNNVTVQVGDQLAIDANTVTCTPPTKISFKMPEVPEDQVGTLLRVVVTNEDGGVAASDQIPVTVLDHSPIYIQFTKGETSPQVTGVTPALGPAQGGTAVTITGKDFRQSEEGYDGKTIAVYFGATPATNVTVVDYYTITATTAASNPGKVDVKVENPDSESSSLKDAFTYISAPTITDVSLVASDNQTSTAETISTAGGQTLKITGTQFMDGCKVYFSPVLTAATDLTASNLLYLTSNGILNPYVLTSGDAGSNVTKLDANTITVTTPTGKLNATGLIVVNPDGGVTPLDSDITYTLPQLEAPGGVSAVLVHDDHNDTDRFIKVQWSPITGASAYEVYVVSGDNTDFVGSTIYTSLIYSNLEPNTSYRFIIKAVGDYGSSPPSVKSERVHTGDNVGPPDEDGKLGQKTGMVTSGSTLTINVGTEDRGNNMNIDLTQSQYAGVHQVQVNLPAQVIYDSRGSDIKIIGADFKLDMKTEVFRNSSLDTHQSDRHAGVSLQISPYTGDPGVQGGNSLSTVYQLKANSFVGQDSKPLDQLSGYMLFTINYDNAKARLRHYTSMNLCQLNSASGLWQPVSYGSANVGGLWMITQMGLYSVIGSRR
ncbi:MAG TPA: IPT/TIG domain-containing protein [Syntrophomonadaceae bacterium]|nr:IPT/TIG domain-containing protein [Syntrophomonadaceae bacterium]